MASPVDENTMRLVDQRWFDPFLRHLETITPSEMHDPDRRSRFHESVSKANLQPEDGGPVRNRHDLQNALLNLWIVDCNRRDERWCDAGFRHRTEDGDYATGSTVGTLTRLFCSESWKVALQREDESTKKGEHEWSVQKSIQWLHPFLEETARLVDRFRHFAKPRAEGGTWADIAEPGAMSADIITDVALENTLKTLWKIANPEKSPASWRHSSAEIYESLADFHPAILDVAQRMPFMFNEMRHQTEIEREIQWLFNYGPPDFVRKQSVRSRYWWVTNWPTHSVAIPISKFGVALAVYVVAVQTWGGDPAT